MKNFDITQWCDYVRGLSSPEDAQAMAALQATEPEAARTAELFGRVQAVAEADLAMEIPASALRIVKAAASVRRPAAEEIPDARWRFLNIDVLFDSLRQPAMMGVRDLGMSHRQISLKAEAFMVDVRWEHERANDSGSLVGQLMNEDATQPVPDIPVLMVSDGRIVGRSVTNDLGEFQGSSLPNQALDLYVLVGEDTCITVALEENDTI